MPAEPNVLRRRDVDASALGALLRCYGLALVDCAAGQPIPGSYWGGDEAGLIGNRLYARAATPLHSILHEACHFICADDERRAALDTDAGSDDLEECAVCYLQILLADELSACGRERMFADMDAWGYSFRLGSSRAWFERDADDARAWLLRHGLIGEDGRPGGRSRRASSTRPEPETRARIPLAGPKTAERIAPGDR